MKMPMLKLFFDYASKMSSKKHTGSKYIIAKDFYLFLEASGVAPKLISEQELYLIFL